MQIAVYNFYNSFIFSLFLFLNFSVVCHSFRSLYCKLHVSLSFIMFSNLVKRVYLILAQHHAGKETDWAGSRCLLLWSSIQFLQSFCLFFHRVPDLMEPSHYKTRVPKVFHFPYTVWLWFSVFTPIWGRRKLLRGWLSKAVIYEYSKMPLRVICLLYFSSRAMIFDFTLDPWTFQSQILCQSGIGSISWSKP